MQVHEVLSKMSSIYRAEGLEILGSFARATSLGLGSDTQYVAKGRTVLSSSAGISLDEQLFLFGLSEILKPKSILIVGNSYGLSTVFLALCNPGARTVALDKYRTEGIRQTEVLTRDLGDVRVVQASTPDDLEKIISDHFPEGVDLVLLDAVHENHVQTLEYKKLNASLSHGGVVVMHDVLSCDLLDSFFELKDSFQEDHFVLCPRTASGLAVGIKGGNLENFQDSAIGQDLLSYLDFFDVELEKVVAFQQLIATSNLSSKYAEFMPQGEGTEMYSFPPHPQL